MDVLISPNRRFDAQALQALCDTLHRTYVADGPLPHMQIAIQADGVTVLQATMGAARENGAPLRPDALYRIASMTKPVTSVAFLMLMEQGKVAPDTLVKAILPEFSDLRVMQGVSEGALITRPCNRDMTMLDLLIHTSGLTYSFQNRTPIDRLYAEQQLDVFHQKRSPEEYLRALADIPLEFSPGEAWNYSVSTDVLGIVVERISGQSLDAFFAQNIFAPLGMEDSFFVVPPDKLHRLTDAWMVRDSGEITVYDRGEGSRWRMAPRTFSGGGGLVSSCTDYLRFGQMLLEGGELGGVRLLQPETVAMMTRNHLPDGGDLTTWSRSMFSESGNEGVGFGLGVSVAVDPSRNRVPASPGEYRWGGLLSTSFFVDPVERLVVVMMTQLLPSSATNVRASLNHLVHGALNARRGGKSSGRSG